MHNRHYVVLDLYDIRHPHTGIGVFCNELGKHIALMADDIKLKHNIAFLFIVPTNQVGAYGNKVAYIPFSDSNNFKIKKLRLFPKKIAVLHLTHQYSRVKKMYFAKKQLMTIHDINFMYEHEGHELKKRIKDLEKRIKLVDALAFISQFSKQDTLSHFSTSNKKTLKVIYNGATDLRPQTHDYSYSQKDYLLHISSLIEKKNPLLLIQMMRFLPNEKLIMVGNWDTDYGSMMRDIIRKEKIDNIEILSNVDEQTKSLLYKNCKAFLFPSRCEGFGLPPIEAMYFGKPVYLSTLTSLPEIGSDKAYYWENLSPSAMADHLRKTLPEYKPEQSIQIQEYASQFNWNKCVDEYVQYYVELISNR